MLHGNPPAPFALWIGGVRDDLAMIKPATGLVKWRPRDVVVEVADARSAVSSGVRRVEVDGLTPASAEALAAKLISMEVRTLINATSVGSYLPPDFVYLAAACLRGGVDVASGAYARLSDDTEVVRAWTDGRAKFPRVGLHDYRYTDDRAYPLATGERRSGLRLLTVGGDGALGKKYTALTIQRAIRSLGMKSTFCATGQTGRLLCDPDDRFVVLDALQADFVSGAAEWLTPSHDDPGHWYIIEGQGAPAHPAWCACSTGLLLGSQPDGIVYCLELGRREMRRTRLPVQEPASDAAWQVEAVRRSVNSECRLMGFSVNGSVCRDDSEEERLATYGLPVFDPSRDDSAMRVLIEEMYRMSVAARAALHGGEG